MRFINRDWTKTEHDDWLLNVQPLLTENTESVPIYHDSQLVGWKIQMRFE